MLADHLSDENSSVSVISEGRFVPAKADLQGNIKQNFKVVSEWMLIRWWLYLAYPKNFFWYVREI